MPEKQIRVLNVEDDEADRLACRRALAQDTEHAYLVLEAGSGREGLRMAQSEKPDCILLDYRLPDMDGLAFLTHLAEEMGEITIPVIKLTGMSSAAIAVEAMKRGARDYLVKDIKQQYLELLPTVIQRVLREQNLVSEKRRAEAQYRALVEQIAAITYITELDGARRILYVSPQIQVLGFSPQEWQADPDLHINQIHPDDRAHVIESIAKSRATGSQLRSEYRMLARNGRILWFRNEATVVRDDAGQTLFLQGILVDITEAKRVEKALREHRYRLEELVTKRTTELTGSNERLRQEIIEHKLVEHALFEEKERAQVTLNSIGDAVITTNAVGHIEYMNPVAEQLTGWSNAQAHGQPLMQVLNIVNETTREPAPDLVQNCLREGVPTGLPNYSLLIRHDGLEFAIDDSVAPIHNREGEVVGAVVVFRDVAPQRKLTQQLSYQASHDALTGLVNRQEFERRLERILSNAREDGSEHALCYLDLDRFKTINDTCGHAAGDQLLRQLSAMLHGKMRLRDTLARLGGDEFGVLLEHCPIDQATRIAGELRETVQNFRLTWENQIFSVGVSIGIVALSANTENLSTALEDADAACYNAKQAGRNCVRLYQPGDSELALRSVQAYWATQISRALEEDSFQLFYQSAQPLATTTKDRSYHQILPYLADEQGHLVAPETFQFSAARANLLADIERRVITQVIAYCAEHHVNCTDEAHPIYAIGLSSASFCDTSLLNFILELLRKHRVPAQALCFEIGETDAIAHLLQATHFLEKLKQAGCKAALSNFGISLSSFAYLKTLLLDFLKLDGDFIKTIGRDPINRAMVDAINHVAQVTGIQTIATGVMNNEIMLALQDIGVNHAQGYAVMKPRPLTELIHTSPSTTSSLSHKEGEIL